MGNCTNAKSSTLLERYQLTKSFNRKTPFSNNNNNNYDDDIRPQPRRDNDLRQLWRVSIERLSIRSKKSCNNEYTQVVSNETKILELFDKYCSRHESHMICADGIEELCKDLRIGPNDFQVLILSWKLNANKMCKFSRNEFLNGLRDTLKVDNLNDLRMKLSSIELDLFSNQDEFKQLYRWTFDFGLDEGERTLHLEIGILLWQLVYDKHPPIILNKWLNFLKSNAKHIKGIPRDTWCMFHEFALLIGDSNFNSYDDNEAWPCLFDEFVQSESEVNIKQHQE